LNGYAKTPNTAQNDKIGKIGGERKWDVYIKSELTAIFEIFEMWPVKMLTYCFGLFIPWLVHRWRN
jgi:hypothetical protein